MKATLTSFFVCFWMMGSGQIDREILLMQWDSTVAANDAEFKDPDHSPLPEEELKNFEGLSYYPFEYTYVVKAKLELTPNEKPFLMPTTTERLPQYVKYGILHFELEGQTLQLSVYRNIDLSKKAGYENYFFIPFNDSTNGFETYGGGRYMDLQGPLGDSVVLNFNLAYNPYCAYNKMYSCPIPPQENRLPISIKAGVRAYKEH